jgi:polysaccharide export outer membrane protein
MPKAPPDRSLLLSALILACLYCVSAQTKPAAAPEFQGANLPAQKVGPNDLIAVSVYDAPELSRTLRVGADGFVRLPMLKQPVKAQGLMPAELEIAIAAALREGGILVDPYVTVTVAEYNSHPISVAGAVKQPLTFQAAGPVTLLEAITRAGGLSPEAGSEILVSRAAADPNGASASLVQRIPVHGLIDAADPALNIPLTGGEEIRIPEAGRFFVVGNVKKPGAYPIQDGRESSVLKALAVAEGLEPFATNEAYVYRREASGSKNEIAIPLKQIMQRKAPDVALLANDILYIPDNAGRRLKMSVLEKVLLFGGTAGATALVYGTYH